MHDKVYAKGGLSAIEILISISILFALSLIGIWHMSRASSAEALIKDHQGLIALLNEARSLSLSSKNASQYGVHLEEFKAILFKGSAFSAGAPDNSVHEYNSKVRMSASSLDLGGADILFSRLTGEVANFGTITLSLISDPLSSTLITIGKTGVIE